MPMVKGNIIWTNSQTPQTNQWVCFRDTFLFQGDGPCFLEIAVDSKYTLYVNGRLVVLDGGLNWGSAPEAGYYDRVELTPYLMEGENQLAILVWYWGNEGRCNLDSGLAGLLYTVTDKERVLAASGPATRVCKHPSYLEDSGAPYPSYLYGGYNIAFDAGRDLGNWTALRYDDSGWEPAQVVDTYPCEKWRHLEPRPIPLFRFSEVVPYASVDKEGTVYTCRLPCAAHVSPYIKVRAKGGETLDIRTDRYLVNGGPGGEQDLYASQRIIYITKEGEQEFLALNWYFGEAVLYTIPDTVEIVELGYRESSYACEVIFPWRSRYDRVNRLMDKCARTLLICMRDNFMDCPDRERGQWIGDVSVQTPQVFDVLSPEAVSLVRKAITDFITFRHGDILCGNVPGACRMELPSQSLNAISEVGMIAEYYRYTGDKTVLEMAFEPMKRYLLLWEMEEDGLVCSRSGDWKWFDHLDHIDETVLENAWYFSALGQLLTTAKILGKSTDLSWAVDRRESIRLGVNTRFWTPEGYASGDFLDERANAMALLSGIAGTEQYPVIGKVLCTVQRCTPYMEYYVLKAMCEMNLYQEAFDRMMDRYAPLIDNENSTLWEDFHILGTRNHAWSGGPLTILLEYLRYHLDI